MEIFLEKQYLKPWWRFIMILAVIFVVVGTAYIITANAEDDVAIIVSIISILIILPVVVALYSLKLETRIDEKGIFTYFSPLKFTQTYIPWEEVNSCFVRKYNSIENISNMKRRGLGRNWIAYNIDGNDAIEVGTSTGNKYLISTLKPKEAEATINQYFNSSKPGIS